MVAISRILQHNIIVGGPGESYSLGVQFRSVIAPCREINALNPARIESQNYEVLERRQYEGAQKKDSSVYDRQETGPQTLFDSGIAQRLRSCLRRLILVGRLGWLQLLPLVWKFSRKLLFQMPDMPTGTELSVRALRYWALSGIS
jgi:hypothetical protein